MEPGWRLGPGRVDVLPLTQRGKPQDPEGLLWVPLQQVTQGLAPEIPGSSASLTQEQDQGRQEAARQRHGRAKGSEARECMHAG